MVFLSTIVHCAIYSAFSLGFLANSIVHFSGPYILLLGMCLLQVIVDIVIMNVPDYSATMVTLANLGVLILCLTVQSLTVRLLCLWSNSVLPLIPQHPHRVVVITERALLGLHFIASSLGFSAIICLGIPNSTTYPQLARSAMRILFATLLFLVIESLIVAGLALYLGIYTLRKAPKGMDIRRKRNQIIRLIVVALLLVVFFVFTGIGLFSSAYVVYAGGCTLYFILLAFVWPGALSDYDRLPGERVVELDPDGTVTIRQLEEPTESHQGIVEEPKLQPLHAP